MEPDPPVIASSQPEAQVDVVTEKEHDGTIHCKVLDMKVKIDFNDKRSKFIQLLSMDEEDEVKNQTNAKEEYVEENHEDKRKTPPPFIESSIEENEDRNESDATCDVSNTNGEIIKGAIAPQENTDSVIKKDECLVLSEVSHDETTPQFVEEEDRIPDKQLFWAGFSVKPNTGVDIENEVFKKIHAGKEVTEEKSDLLAACQGITDDLSRIQNAIDGIVLEQNQSTETIGEPDVVEEKQLKNLPETEQAWTGNQYRQIINGTVYYFDNSDATKKNDQGAKEAEPEVNNNTVIDGEAFLANLKSKWMIETDNDGLQEKVEETAATSEYIVCDPSEYGIVEQLHGEEDDEAPEEKILSDQPESITSEDPTSSEAGDSSRPKLDNTTCSETPDKKMEAMMDTDDSWCTKRENKLAAMIGEKSETATCSPTAATTKQESLKGSNEDPVHSPLSPTDPGMENNRRQARPNLEKNCNIDADEDFLAKPTQEPDTKAKEVLLEDLAEDDLPHEKPISISRMKNEACKDLNIKPMQPEKAKRPKSSKTNQDENLDIKLYLAEEKSRKRPKSGMDNRAQGVERRPKDTNSEIKLVNNEKPMTRPKSAKIRGNRASPTFDEKQKLSNRPQSCRQRGKEGAMTANFPSRNCKNIMELLTEADTDNLDFLNKREAVLPSKSYNGKFSMF